jgi:thiamine biosynthesis lipoprotein
VELTGQTMGSNYIIKYKGEHGLYDAIDSILIEFNSQFSTYDETSIITKFNNNDTQSLSNTIMNTPQCNWWKQMMLQSSEAYNLTDGDFDPSLGPLLSYWGFGDHTSNPDEIESAVLDSLRLLTGFNKFTLTGCLPQKHNPDARLNFNALAAGLAVDIIAEYLENSGITDYLINITGEIRAKGKNPKGETWTTSIENPIDNPGLNPPFSTISLTDESLATSGNYRNFFKREGKKYSHTINPQTGYPTQNNMQSASVITDNTAMADALATAFMVCGVEKTKYIVLNHKNLEAFLIWEEDNEMKTWMSEGFASKLK